MEWRIGDGEAREKERHGHVHSPRQELGRNTQVVKWELSKFVFKNVAKRLLATIIYTLRKITFRNVH